MYHTYKVYMLWAIVSGAICVGIGYNTLTGIISSKGITADYWMIGLGVLYPQLI